MNHNIQNEVKDMAYDLAGEICCTFITCMDSKCK